VDEDKSEFETITIEVRVPKEIKNAYDAIKTLFSQHHDKKAVENILRDFHFSVFMYGFTQIAYETKIAIEAMEKVREMDLNEEDSIKMVKKIIHRELSEEYQYDETSADSLMFR